MVYGVTFGKLYNFYLEILFICLFIQLSIYSYIFIFKVNVWRPCSTFH